MSYECELLRIIRFIFLQNTMHYSVMASNVLNAINKMNMSRNFLVADCNFGLGGHSNAILQRFPNATIKAWELDPMMIEKYKQITTGMRNSRLTIYNQNFTELPHKQLQNKFDVILGDLGFNSLQLQTIKGLSWNKDSELDMRYSQNFPKCSQIINRLSFIEMDDILIKFGDLTPGQANLAAQAIIKVKPILTSFQLRDAIVGCFQKNKQKKIAQIFQAFRISTNRQIESLRYLLRNLSQCLNKNSLVMMITFHSLERQIIFDEISKSKFYSKIEIEKPSKQQIAENSRSSSAQMLYFRKIK